MESIDFGFNWLLNQIVFTLRKGHCHSWWSYCISSLILFFSVYVVNTSRSFPHSWLITTQVPRRVNSSCSTSDSRRVNLVTNPVISHEWGKDTFSFGHCVVCSSSIYGFWLPLWYLQNFLRHINISFSTSCTLY
jgi:hypothetical protein